MWPGLKTAGLDMSEPPPQSLHHAMIWEGHDSLLVRRLGMLSPIHSFILTCHPLTDSHGTLTYQERFWPFYFGRSAKAALTPERCEGESPAKILDFNRRVIQAQQQVLRPRVGEGGEGGSGKVLGALR